MAKQRRCRRTTQANIEELQAYFDKLENEVEIIKNRLRVDKLNSSKY